MKLCKACGEEKPETEYYYGTRKCKVCTRAAVSANYYKNRKQYAAYERERSQRPGRKRDLLEYQRKRRAKYPEKNRARNAVANALRYGRLERGVCEVCGSEIAEAHHDDYNKPLEVRWLCRKHHLEVHGKMAIEGLPDDIEV